MRKYSFSQKLSIVCITGLLVSFSLAGLILLNNLGKSYSQLNINHSNYDYDIPLNQGGRENIPILPLAAVMNDESASWEPLFTSIENCTKLYSAQQTNSDPLSLTIPENYDEANFNISMNIMNNSLNEIIIENSISQDYSRAQQAQSFIIQEKCILNKIAIHGGSDKKQDPTTEIQIRNSSYEGPVLREFEYVLTKDWNEITLNEPLSLTEGEYFVCMESLSSPSTKAWIRTSLGDNDTETWVFDGNSWELSDFDLSLKLYTRKGISPEDVNLSVEGNSVLNKEGSECEGKVFVSKQLPQDYQEEIQLCWSSNADIHITYWASASFSRINNCSLLYKNEGSDIDWEVYVNSSVPDPGVFSNYLMNISGLSENHFDLVAYNGNTPVSYLKPNPSCILVDQFINRLRFKSENQVEFDIEKETIKMDETLNFSLSSLNTGIIKINITLNDNLIYQNITNSSDNFNFRWDVPEELPGGELNLSIFYFGDNQYGYSSKTLNLIRSGHITPLISNIKALEDVVLKCNYYDLFTFETIDDAHLEYQINGISDSLSQNIEGNYSSILDLNIHALKPGTYDLIITATKEGYDPQTASFPITIEKREASLELSQSAKKVIAGEKVSVSISLSDKFSSTELLRNIDVKTSVFKSGDNNVGELVYWSRGINREDGFNLEIPEEMEAGSYNILVEVESEYYSGSLLLEDGLVVNEVDQKPSLLFYVCIFGTIGLGLSTTIYIKKKKSSVRKSLNGMILLHKDGVPLGQMLSEDLKKQDPTLIAGAVTGTMSIIREITGKDLHTIGVEGGYIHLRKSENYWLIVFLKRNPRWIKSTIEDTVEQINEIHGEFIRNFDGKLKDLSLHTIIQNQFGEKNILMQQIPNESEEECDL